MFWKFCESAESIEAAKKDLVLLRKRNELLCTDDPSGDGGILCVCVDNCCIVGPKIESITGPETSIKLDSFHWQQRWDNILYDKKSEKTSMFRKLMRRALFVIEDHEIARVEAYLTAKKKKKPSAREIFKEAKATIPPPEQLERRVMAVLHALMEKDLLVDRNRIATASTASEGRFFKAGANSLNTIINQMSHVKKGCLSDPPDTVFNVFRVNPKTGKTYTARSTGTNEVDNRYLNRLLDTPSVGLTRADRLIHSYYERSNENKMVNRLGMDPSETSRAEQVSMLHSLSSECGFDDFPKKKPVRPGNVDVLDERIGFDCHLPAAFATSTEDEEEEEDGMADFLDDIFVDDADFEEPAEFDHPVNCEEEDNLQPNDVFGMDSLVDVSICMPKIEEHERTHDTFVRKTQQQPWTPFAHPKDALSFSAKDKAEHELCNEMAPACSRNAKSLDGPTGF